MMTIEQHNEAMLRAFAKVVGAEERIRLAKVALDEATATLKLEMNAGEKNLADAWAEVEKLMAGTGEVEVTLPGAANDFRIGWGNPRESVKADPDATPDEFCTVVRKPRLAEIGVFLKQLREKNLVCPNWASFERGERKLGYRVIKKGTV